MIEERSGGGEESPSDGRMEPVNLACLLAPGAGLIFSINTLSDLEPRSRLPWPLTAPLTCPLPLIPPTTRTTPPPRPSPFLSYFSNFT